MVSKTIIGVAFPPQLPRDSPPKIFLFCRISSKFYLNVRYTVAMAGPMFAKCYKKDNCTLILKLLVDGEMGGRRAETSKACRAESEEPPRLFLCRAED